MRTHLLHWTKSDEKIERVTFTADQGALIFAPRIDQPEMKLDVTGHLRAKMQMRALAEALLRYLEDNSEAHRS